MISQQSPFQEREQERKEKLLWGIFSLAGSGTMMTVCLCYLFSMILGLVTGVIAMMEASSQIDGFSSKAGGLVILAFLVVAIISIVFTFAFWRCHSGGTSADKDKLSGALVTLRVFAIIYLVISIQSLLTDGLSAQLTLLSAASTAFNIVFYAVVQKALLDLIRSVRRPSWCDTVSKAVPVFLFIRVGFSLLGNLVPDLYSSSTLSDSSIRAATELGLIGAAISLVSAICITVLLSRHRKLCEELRAASVRDAADKPTL